MKPVLIDIIAGARPNFMKVAPIIRAIKMLQQSKPGFSYRLVHTGQHYDQNMSGDFFLQLGISQPDVNLEAGPGSQGEQTAAIMVRYEEFLLEKRSDLCLVVGDVTSTMACSIAARKLGIEVAHVEGGLRSGDRSMPEEINRLVTDSIADYFFTTSVSAGDNLRREGVGDSRIFFVGNTMIDTLSANMDKLRPPLFWKELNLTPGQYLVLTLHRPVNVEDAKKFNEILKAISDNCRGLPVIFSVHPRSVKTLNAMGSLPVNIKIVDPQAYLEFNYLVKYAKAVITDSGGVTEETTFMGVPCLTMRDTTERPETVTMGTNELVGSDPSNLAPIMDKLFSGQWKKGNVPPQWDGKTGERIVSILEGILCAGA